jgi:hypothetical protein
VQLEGGGHELSPAHWDQIVGAIVEHTNPNRFDESGVAALRKRT